jgi:hypothetical protein
MSLQKNLKKIYIDSRFRTSDSSSTSNFKIQLQDILHFEENTSYLINEISFPNTFRSVETGINDKLYIKWFFYDLIPKTTAYSIITIPSDNYTGFSLGTTLKELLKLAVKEYTIREDYWTFNCSYTQSINSFTISATLKSDKDKRNTWQILTDYELKNIDPSIIHNSVRDPGPYDINNLCSFNDNIKNNDMYSDVFNGDKAKIGYTCEFLDLHSIKNIYIYSNIGNYNSIAPNGNIANISKKICLTSDFAYLLVDNTAPIHDGLSCSNKTLSYLEFKICNTAGTEIPLHKQNISFSVVFFKVLDT